MAKGHVRQRGKTWYGVYREPGKKNPRWERLEGAVDRTQAEAALRAIMHRMDRGIHVEPHARTVSDLIDEFIELQTIRYNSGELRTNTYRTYCLYLERHARTYLGAIKLQELRMIDVQRMYGDLTRLDRDPKPMARTSLKQLHFLVRSMLSYAEQENYVARNVARTVKIPKLAAVKGSGRRKSLSLAETHEFLDAHVDDDMQPVWRLAIHTGLRRSELCGLTWENVDLDAAILRVVRARTESAGHIEVSAPKTDAGRRTVTLDPGAVDALRKIRARQAREKLHAGPIYESTDYVLTNALGQPLRPDQFTKLTKAALRKSGLGDKTLHGLRHTHVTILTDGEHVNNAAIAERIGHTDVGFTMRCYASPDEETHRATAASFGERMSR